MDIPCRWLKCGAPPYCGHPAPDSAWVPECGIMCLRYEAKCDHKMATFRIYSTTRLDSLCLAHAPIVVFYTPNGGCLNIICDDPGHARSLLIAAVQQLDEEVQIHEARMIKKTA